jgi:group II intron reverse transcriptase/maturase
MDPFSMEALTRAWRAVRANGGGPGVDGVDIARFEARLEEELTTLSRELRAGTYQPRPALRIFIPKPQGGLRPMAIWALRDRVAQRAVYEALLPFFEPMFLDCSHGFRPGRSVETAVEAVKKARDAGRRWVLDADIQDCFERIDPRRLMERVRARVRDRRLVRLVERWVFAGLLQADGRIRAAGAAQGGVLSPLLANIYLHSFDQTIIKHGFYLVRYADDFVIMCRSQNEALRAQQVAEQALHALGLKLHPHKTRIVSFDQGFKFLGYFFVRDEIYCLT